VSPIPYAIALSRMEVSIVYPMVVALTSLILLPLTIIFFKESFSFYKVIGISLIILSMYLLNR
jgi:multidrug transporter EmrE-like cation transporter